MMPHHSSARGFTLVETLVAIAIMLIAIMGPFYVVSNAVTASQAARDQLIATYLAQEGVEYIRSVRDANYLSGNSWTTGLTACLPGPCVVDPSQAPPNNFKTIIAPLYLSATNLYNQQGSGTVTRFTRTASITNLNSHEEQVTITVTWQSVHASKTITVVDYLENWL